MKKPNDIVMNPKLELALKGFIPESGNLEDITIVKDLGKLYKKLGTINTQTFRELEKRKAQNQLTSKMYEVQREEESLIRRITSRNLDF